MGAQRHQLKGWGWGGALFAALFAIWMLFFPELVISNFAWPAEPRLMQAFIGAGYIFRTGFFLSVALEPAWYRVRWIYWGNLVFTGTLLLATFWHADRLSWFFVTAHVWIILYVVEPVLMIYLAPQRGTSAWTEMPTTRGPIQTGLRWLLILEVCALGTFGFLLILNPTFMDLRWPWSLNPFDARIMAAWLLGWATWAGTMAFARDWEEIRLAARLNILFGLALLGNIVAFFSLYDFSRMTTWPYIMGVLVLTLLMGFCYWRQEQVGASISHGAAPAPAREPQ